MNWNHIPTPLQDKQYGMSQKAANLPLQPIGISNNANDPTNWSSFQDVSKAIQKNNSVKQCTGTGFDFTVTDNFAGYDTNDCLNYVQSHRLQYALLLTWSSANCDSRKQYLLTDCEKYLTKPTTSKRRNNDK